MISIDDKLVSDELFTERFACDLTVCRGQCCVEGDAGAPLELDEVYELEVAYDAYRPYLKPEGIAVLRREGFMVVDADGDYTTPLIRGVECAYSYEENGVTLCAIERAWAEGRTTFRKPISCHLYPVRLVRLGGGMIGLNYHRWDVCAVCARKPDARPVYQVLREPIVRHFGEEFYAALEAAARYLGGHSNRR